MIYSPDAVATIINLVISSHIGAIETVDIIDFDVAWDIMFHVSAGENVEAIKAIYYRHPLINLKAAHDAVKAVKAYLG